MPNGAADRVPKREITAPQQPEYHSPSFSLSPEQWKWEALHDPLTGIANRRLLEDRLGQALRRQARTAAAVAVIFLDLDRFREVNGRHGHCVGDQVLAAVAARMSREVRAVDTVARLGGDEFVIVVEDLPPVEATALAERVRQAIARPVRLSPALGGNPEVAVTASMGLAYAEHDDPQRVLHVADAAMYAAKRQGGNRCTVTGAEERPALVAFRSATADAWRGEPHHSRQTVGAVGASG